MKIVELIAVTSKGFRGDYKDLALKIEQNLMEYYVPFNMPCALSTPRLFWDWLSEHNNFELHKEAQSGIVPELPTQEYKMCTTVHNDKINGIKVMTCPYNKANALYKLLRGQFILNESNFSVSWTKDLESQTRITVVFV